MCHDEKVLRRGHPSPAWHRPRATSISHGLHAVLLACVLAFVVEASAQGELPKTDVAASRTDVTTEGAPFRGPATALVTIVEFQDFHCPYCAQVQPTLSQLVERYGERIRIVHRDFPIDKLHPRARKAHEAARCANDQGKFWPFHDVLYAQPRKAGPEELKADAQLAGLDVDAFERCVASGTHQAAVQRDIDEGIRAGVTSTPSFFINGRPLRGAQPLERFSRLIDGELAGAH